MSKVPKQQLNAMIEKIFQKYDKDDSGSLDLNEIQ